MPFTIRATWLPEKRIVPEGRLFIWAEHPAPESSNGTPGNGRDRSPRVPSHPAQVPVGQLRHLVGQLMPSLQDLGAHPGNATVWLPTQAHTPLTRRGVLQQGVAVRERESAPPITLAPWQVTGLYLPPYPALSLLSRLSPQRLAELAEPTSILRHIRLGNDLLFWGHAAKFVLEILAGQHYLPTLLADSHGHFHSVWQPYLQETNLSQQLETLIQAMPPVCRGYNLERPQEAPAPSHLAEHFVTVMVNAAIRQWRQASLPGSPPGPESSPARHWIHQLLAPQSRLHLPPQPAHRLYKDWLSWTEQLHVTGGETNIRLCFQLEEPDQARQGTDSQDGQEQNWILRYFLQARDDPTVLAPARQVWQEHRNNLRIGKRRFEQPQERLLAGLGMAGRLFPPIQRSLRSPRPEMALLSTQEAYQFLREIGPLLESSGFGVILPPWWRTRIHTRLGLRLRFTSPQADGAEQQLQRLSQPIRFRWELTLGGEPLGLDEFERLAARRSPLVQVRGRWVELDPEQMAVARDFLASGQTEGQMSLLQALRIAQRHQASQPDPGWDGEGPSSLPQANAPDLPLDLQPLSLLPLDTVEVEGWLQEALERLRSQEAMAELPEPEGFVGELRPYQRRGVGWLWYLRQLGLGACLADDMGLGKTIQAIALLLHVREEARKAEPAQAVPPALLICPTSLVANWRREIGRFAPGLRALIHHGSNRLAGQEFQDALAEHDLVITSYGTARRDIQLLRAIQWSDLILDEAQNIKNPGAKQTQAVRQLQAQNRVALTGTPVENRLLELWSIMEFLNPGYLESRERFRQKYVLPIERYNDAHVSQELRQLVQPFLLRRLKTDPTIISDLPEKNEMVVYCPLSEEQAQLYQQVVQETMDRVEKSQGIQRRGVVLSLLMKLKQVCNHPAHYLKEEGPLDGRSGKLSRLTEMLEEALSVGDRALVFTQFVEMGHLLQRHLEATLGCDVLFLHGGSSPAQREQMVNAFQEEENGPSVFILSLRAGGVGLNLTRANQVFHFDRWWNPAVEDQATDRAFRIGQTRRVQVYKFVVAGTLEERIHELIESKQALAENIVGSGEDWLAEINAEELRRLLELRMDGLDS